ncbi:nectin-3 [Cimex lectularius]|uniref:Ig-like domain-containing protein n=1 Tax=Cimex lectularius TaxID=79782 RepID=A0A8I6S6E1_CIMLE|nr:nectin-3 [Cimex lectularius]
MDTARFLLTALLIAAALANSVVGDYGVEVRVREGGRAVLPCRGSSAGTNGAIAWKHRGEPIGQDPRYHPDRSASSLIITRVRPTDSGPWSCSQHAPPVNLVVLEPPRAPYLLIDSRRLDPGNLFVPVKENSKLSVECVVEGGSPAPGLHWLLVPPPGSTSPPGLNQQESAPAATQGFTRSVASIPRVLRDHHNSTVACIVTHQTLPAPLNASILLDVQFTPSFAITRVPGFGIPLREGIPVSLKCDVDSNPPSLPVWQKDDGAPPVEQSNDGFLNFTSLKREHNGWYKCTTRHLLSTYSSIGYFLNVRYGDGEMNPGDIEVGGSTEAATGSGNAVEVSVGGAVQLECGGNERGCWGRVSTSGQVSPLGQGAPLSIHSVLYQQAGHYRCYAPEPDRLNAWRTHNVHLKVTGVPMVLARNLSKVAEVGDAISLLAEYCASPSATKVLWILPTARVIAPGTTLWGITAHNITNGNWTNCHKALLTVDRVGKEHEGEFSLLVWSGRGIGQTTIRLNVTGNGDTSAGRGMASSSALLVAVIAIARIC